MNVKVFDKFLRELGKEGLEPRRKIFKVIHPSVRKNKLYSCYQQIADDGYDWRFDYPAFAARAAFYSGWCEVEFVKIPEFTED